MGWGGGGVLFCSLVLPCFLSLLKLAHRGEIKPSPTSTLSQYKGNIDSLRERREQNFWAREKRRWFLLSETDVLRV